MKEELAALYALQQQDSLLAELKRQFRLLDSGIKEKAEYDAAEEVTQAAKQAMSGASGELRDAELEQQQVEVKRKEHEKKLYGGTIHIPKELQALQDEIEMLVRQRTRLDDKIIVLIEAIEARKKEQAAAATRLRTARAALKDKQAAYRIEAERIRNKAEEVINSRPAFVSAVTKQLNTRYEALKLIKAGVAIVAIQDGNACGGCKMTLPSSLVTRVHEGSGIELCQNCGRMLCELAKEAKAAPSAR